MLIGLILVIITVFIVDLITVDSLDALKSVPTNLETASANLLSGQGKITDGITLTTLLSAAFLHGDLGHILSNMLFLWVFAGLVGELLGWRWMLGLFIITAICGSIADAILRGGSEIPVVGASGAVLGFEGAYLGLAVRWSLPNPHIWPIAYPIPPSRLALVAGVGFFLDVSGAVGPATGIAYGAHLGGFLAGLFLTCFLIPKPKKI